MEKLQAFLTGLSEGQRKNLRRILFAGASLIVLMLLPLRGWWNLLFFLPYYAVGYDILLRSGKNLLHGQVFDENFLMSLATVGALCLGQFPEAVFVMLFYQVGELFESIAVGKSRRNIAALMDIRPESAELYKDGQTVTVSPEEVAVGDRILVRPGQRIPLDGRVLEGNSGLDTSALTGESIPRNVKPGDTVYSGCINGEGMLLIEVSAVYENSTVSKVLELVESAADNKAKTESFITTFAKYYTPAVVILAVLLAFLPPLFRLGSFTDWIYRALGFLVVSCPCAVVISVPMSYFGGIGAASKEGILIKGSNFMEALGRCTVAVFDKTGTLTEGSFSVTEINPVGVNENTLLALAAAAEKGSEHPIAKSLRNACQAKLSGFEVTDVTEIPGKGLLALVAGHRVCVGNAALMADMGATVHTPSEEGTVLYVVADCKYIGYIRISDKIKAESPGALAELKTLGIKETVMLSGDRKEIAQAVSERLGIDRAVAELLPQDKTGVLEEIIHSPHTGTVCYVGDGINDAPCIALADVGVAMGGLGSDAAIEAADIVLMDDNPAKLPAAISIARRTRRIVYENIFFSLGVKLAALVLTALSLVGLWAAVFADVGVAALATLNAMRAMNVKK